MNMKTTHSLVRGENAQIYLTITVPADAVQTVYAQSVRDVAKKAHIKGFRKGKVPVGVLEDKFGHALKSETLEKVMSNSIQEVFQVLEEKPLPYSQPSLQDGQNLDFVEGEDFSFTIVYDSDPKVDACDVNGLNVPGFEMCVSDEDVAKELEGIQERNAVMSDKTGAIENGDVVTVTLVELGEHGDEIAGTKRENFTATIGSQQTLYDLDEDLVGLSQGQSKTVSKDFAEDYKFAELAGKSVKLKVSVTTVKQKNLPDIDNELAQDVSEKYKTLHDLKEDLKKQLHNRAQYMIEELQKKKILEHMLEHSTVEIPKSAVQVQLEHFWQRFVSSNGNNEDKVVETLKGAGQTKEQLFELWRENAVLSVKEQLIIEHLIKKESISISDDEAWNIIKEECEKTEMNFEEMKEYYTKQQALPRIKYDMEQKKLFDILKNRTTITIEGQKMSFLDLMTFYEKSQRVAENVA